MEIAQGVHQIDGIGFVNAFLIVGKRLTLIDTGVRGTRWKIEEYIRRLGRYPVEIDQVVITHAHGDHVGGLAELRRGYDLTVAAHEEDAPFIDGLLTLPKPERGPVLGMLFGLMNRFAKTSSSHVDVLLRDGDCTGPDGEMQVIHTPGHTPGSICLYLPDRRVLLTGDALVNRGNRMSPSPRFFSLDAEQGRSSVQKLAGLEVEAIGFGHGAAVTHDADTRLRSLLESLAQ